MFAAQVSFDVPDFPALPAWAYYPAGVLAWYFLTAVAVRAFLPRVCRENRGLAVAVWFGLPGLLVIEAGWFALSVFTVGLVPWPCKRFSDHGGEVFAFAAILTGAVLILSIPAWGVLALGMPLR